MQELSCTALATATDHMRLCRNSLRLLAAIVNQSASNGVQAFARQIKMSSQCSQATCLTQTKRLGCLQHLRCCNLSGKAVLNETGIWPLENDSLRLEAFSDGCLSTQFLGSRGCSLNNPRELKRTFPQKCFPQVNTLAIRMNLASMQDLPNILQDADSKQFLRIVKHPTSSTLHGDMWNQVLHNRTPSWVNACTCQRWPSESWSEVELLLFCLWDGEDRPHLSAHCFLTKWYCNCMCFAKHVCQTGIMGLYDGLGAGIWRQACKSIETLRIVQFWRNSSCLHNFNWFYILQSADFLCEQQIWIVGDLSWPLQSPCSVAWNTMRFQVFRDTLAKYREVIVGENSWGHWRKNMTWYENWK